MPKRAQRAPDSNTYRFFVAPTALDGTTFDYADSGFAHQIGTVLRLTAGSHITVLDNSGREYRVVLQAVERGRVRGEVEAHQPAGGEPRLQLTLCIAVLKGERFEWVLQKGTELGVGEFVPMSCERSVVDIRAENSRAKIERWERIIREAAEQSRRGRLPTLQPVQPFADVCEQIAQHAQPLLLWENQGIPGLHDLIRPSNSTSSADQAPNLAIFSGPEGGWTDDEIATALRYNVTLVSLGSRILRAETAPIAAAAALFYEHGDLG